jgi:nucleoside-diphosphate-sugar epimerase
MARKRALVTGLGGLIGGALLEHVGGGWQLHGLSRSSKPGVPWHRADIAELADIAAAFTGMDAVVHLAAQLGNASFPDVLQTNVIGTYNVFEAARRAGVGRVVFASSGSVVAGWEREEPYRSLVDGRYDALREWPLLTHASPTRPVGFYGASKAWGEALARHYADAHGMSMICLRVGHVVREDRPLSTRDFSVWCSQRDVAQMIELALEAPPVVRFDVFYAISRNRWGYRDLTHARDILGFEPRDAAEDHR